MKRANALVIGLLVLAVTMMQAAPAARRNVDFKKLRGDMRLFEGIVNTALTQELGNALALVDETRGTYVPGTGITFTLLVNLNRSVVDTPFGKREIAGVRKPQEIKAKAVRDRLITLLSEYGGGIDQLAPDEFIVVAAHMEDRITLNPNEQVQSMVLKVSKKDLTDYQERRINVHQLRTKIEIIEY